MYFRGSPKPSRSACSSSEILEAEILFGDIGFYTGMWILVERSSPFLKNNKLTLEKTVVKASHIMQPARFIGHIWPFGCRFLHVKDHELQQHHLLFWDKWNDIFPNVTTLKTDACVENLHYVSSVNVLLLATLIVS